MSTGKTILIVGGVAAGAFVLFELLKPKTPPARNTAQTGTAPSWISSLLQFGTAAVNTFGTAGPARYGSGAQTQAPTWQDTNGGIDPETGGVYLPEGETYGPPSPGAGSFEPYAPGASSPGPFAPTGGGSFG